MIKTLAIKELREAAWIGALGFAAQMMLVAGAVGVQPLRHFFSARSPDPIPFQDGNIYAWWCFICAVTAVALGLRQSAWESGRGTYLFLLQRPIRRDAIFLVKLATGLAILLGCTAIPILLYAWWALMPGTHPSPAEWSMTVRSWQLCAYTPIFYLAAFLTGIRPVRWLGTRTLPLAATALPAMTLLGTPWIWLLVVPTLLLTYALLVANICFVARTRDY
jgi:hypothetical protein